MKLSIVIPTKGRTEYLITVVKQILNLKLSSYEIVIQDNNETDEISTIFEAEINQGLVRYNHSPEPLSFVSTFEIAVSLSTGDYITLIGDDDFVCPNIIAAVDYCFENKVDSLIPATNVFYMWPGSEINNRRVKALDADEGLLLIKPFTGKSYKTDSRLQLEKLMRRGGVDYLRTDMPKLYHGLVSKRLIEEVIEKESSLFGGLTPDIYSSCLLSIYAKNTIRVDYPITIPGACSKSGSAASSNGGHTGELNEAPHFKHRGSYEWCSLIPAFYSVETIWSDSAYKAIENKKNYADKFKTDLLYSISLYKYSKFESYTVPLLDKSMYYYKAKYLFYKCSKFYIKLREKLISLLGKQKIEYIVIEKNDDVVNKLNDYLTKFNIKDISHVLRDK